MRTNFSKYLSTHLKLADQFLDVILGCQKVHPCPDVFDETGPGDRRESAQHPGPRWKFGNREIQDSQTVTQILKEENSLASMMVQLKESCEQKTWLLIESDCSIFSSIMISLLTSNVERKFSRTFYPLRPPKDKDLKDLPKSLSKFDSTWYDQMINGGKLGVLSVFPNLRLVSSIIHQNPRWQLVHGPWGYTHYTLTWESVHFMTMSLKLRYCCCWEVAVQSVLHARMPDVSSLCDVGITNVKWWWWWWWWWWNI